jgi:hypothetical protein
MPEAFPDFGLFAGVTGFDLMVVVLMDAPVHPDTR